MLNILFADQTDGPLLLLENLWHPGMNLRRPEITRDMLAAVRYPKTVLKSRTENSAAWNPSV